MGGVLVLLGPAELILAAINLLPLLRSMAILPIAVFEGIRNMVQSAHGKSGGRTI